MRQSWDQSFKLLEAYVDREGHALVPHNYLESGFRLGEWVRHQRRAYKSGRLSERKATGLEHLPCWWWEAIEGQWVKAFETLRGFVLRERHCRISAGHVEAGVGLGRWVKYQRSRYRRGALAPERAARLECVQGWSWEQENPQRVLVHNPVHKLGPNRADWGRLGRPAECKMPGQAPWDPLQPRPGPHLKSLGMQVPVGSNPTPSAVQRNTA